MPWLQLLGAMGMVDEDETDWKLIVINVDDANATAYDDVTDVPQVMRCCVCCVGSESSSCQQHTAEGMISAMPFVKEERACHCTHIAMTDTVLNACRIA